MEKPILQQRDLTIDILRGIAIFTMLAANMVGYVATPGSHPLLLRFYGSFAAPLFILLAGIVVAYNANTKNYSIRNYIIRGMMVVFTAVLIDMVIWNIFPFTTFDVLYLIGISIPTVYCFQKIKSRYLKTGIILAVFFITPLLQKTAGYTDYPIEISFLDGSLTVIPNNQTGIINHLFVDGWFPIFPWIGFALLGGLIADFRYDSLKIKAYYFPLIGLASSAIGFFLYFFIYKEEIFPSRGAYSELFYPPTLAYILMAIGIISFLFWIVDTTKNYFFYKAFRIMGTTSMFIYILHTALIALVIIPNAPKDSNAVLQGTFSDSMIVYLLLFLACFIPSLIVYKINSRYKVRNLFYNFYFGS